MGPQRSSFSAAPSMRSLSVWMSVLLLLIFLQLLTSLMCFRGVFILSTEVLISPFLFCETPKGGLPCRSTPGGDERGFIMTAVLALYVPVVLVAFALLAMLLAAYARDRSALCFSMVCQSLSTLLLLAGTIVFVLVYLSYLNWKDITSGFYICVCVQVELMLTTVLTYLLKRRLTSDWM